MAEKEYVFVGCADPRNKTTRVKGVFGEVALGETIQLDAETVDMLRSKGFVFEDEGAPQVEQVEQVEQAEQTEQPEEPVVDNGKEVK